MDQAEAKTLKIASPTVHAIMGISARILQGALMRSSVVRCPVSVETVDVSELAGQAKIDQEDITAAGIHQDVGRLDIVVAVVAGMDVFKSVQHLKKHFVKASW